MTRCSMVTIVAGLIILPAIIILAYTAERKGASSDDLAIQIKDLQAQRVEALTKIVEIHAHQYRLGTIFSTSRPIETRRRLW